MARLGGDIFLEATKEPAILRLPAARYLALDGSGNPESGAFEEAIAAVYGVAYAARAALKERGVALLVSPLEALWWTPRGGPFADPWSAPKEAWRWKVLIRVPRVVGARDVAAAKEAVVSKRGDGPPRVVLLERIAEGRVVQLLHLGGRASEPRSISKMRALMAARGLAPNGRHHEIYLGDPRRTKVERLKTILRQPVK